MAENNTLREEQTDPEENWDENIEQQTTEQQQTTAQEHTAHQQVQTTLNDDDEESEEYNLTAAGGAIRKTQTNVQIDRTTDETKIQTEGGMMAEETQYDSEGHGPKSNLYRERDYTAADEYSIPGDVILQQIENQALITAEEKDQFNTTTNHLTQEQFVQLCDKTRRSFGQLVQYMANTRDVIADYKILRDKDRSTKVILPECYELSDPQSVTQPSYAVLASLGHRARAQRVATLETFHHTYMLCLLSSRLYIRNTSQLHFIHLRVQYTLLSRDSTAL